MNENERIQKDIVLFKQNIDKISEKDKQLKPVQLAEQYHQDAQFYLEKKDYFTAFGCINYAHGLLDAVTFLA
jgi:uncharacterized protein